MFCGLNRCYKTGGYFRERLRETKTTSGNMDNSIGPKRKKQRSKVRSTTYTRHRVHEDTVTDI